MVSDVAVAIVVETGGVASVRATAFISYRGREKEEKQIKHLKRHSLFQFAWIQKRKKNHNQRLNKNMKKANNRNNESTKKIELK